MEKKKKKHYLSDWSSKDVINLKDTSKKKKEREKKRKKL